MPNCFDKHRSATAVVTKYIMIIPVAEMEMLTATNPSPELALIVTSHLGQNDGLGEG